MKQLFCILFAAGMSLADLYPITATVTNKLRGSGAKVLDEATSDLEKRSRQRFLTAFDPDFEIEVRYGPLFDNQLGLALLGTDKRRIFINESVNPDLHGFFTGDDLKAILIHEIGHCFGLPHSPDESNLMFYAYGRQFDLNTAIDSLIKDLNKARGAK